MNQNAQQLRGQIEQLIAAGQVGEARAALRTLWHEHPAASNANFVTSACQRLLGPTAVRKRVAILRSFTVEPVVPLLKASALLAGGIHLDVWVNDFNTHAQDILDPSSSLYARDPHAVILALQTRDAAPELWERFADLSESQADEVCNRVLEQFEQWLTTLRSRSRAAILVHTLDQPERPSMGVLDANLSHSQTAAVQRINDGLRKITRGIAGAYVLDYDALIARHGRSRWYDERKWMTVRLPIAAPCLIHLAEEWSRHLHPAFGRTAKVLVTDLDNTLWQGVVGEDGPKGIRMDGEYPGRFHRNVQRALLDLSRRGLLLAIASKNNEADAFEVIDSHPDMLLRREHFAAIRCNWLDKAANLRDIAAELNVGIDSLVFLDDNPVERQRIRQELPEVTVIELPTSAEGYERAIRDCALFEKLSVSKEDRERTAMYAEQRKRVQLRQQSGTLEDYFWQLDQEVEIRPVSAATVARVAQLTQKTNQFNLTTRRYSEAEIAALAEQPGVGVFEVRVKDSYGDNGITGVAIGHLDGHTWHIDTLLLSCRVIGRTVETALLSFLAGHARQHGARRLEGWFLPTAKNAPAKEFFASHHFQAEREENGNTLWILDLETHPVECPPWIRLNSGAEKVLRATTSPTTSSEAVVCGRV